METSREELHKWLDNILDKAKHDGGIITPSDFEDYPMEFDLREILLNLKDMYDRDFSGSHYNPHRYISELADQIEMVNRFFTYGRYVVTGDLQYTKTALNDPNIKVL